MTNPKKYCVCPNTGIVLPRSTYDVIVIVRAQKEGPPDMQCKDKFLLLNVVAPHGATAKVVKIIPVPGVRKVIDSWHSTNAPFKRPDSYIRMTGDELSRALSSRTTNYDMDSKDEEWLSEQNKGLDTADIVFFFFLISTTDIVSDESFELMIDAFEKAAYYRPDECDDQESTANVCCDLASFVVPGEVCRYWLNKRKQRRALLIRVFQVETKGTMSQHRI